MRKHLFFSIIFISLSLLFNNCSKNPVYPITPEIGFVKYDKYSGNDSLVFTISFKDGDGDLGLESDNTSKPYHEYDIIKDAAGKYIVYDENDPSLPPYSCKKYIEGEYVAPAGLDIIRADYNINHHNYHIEVYVKQMNGTYLKFDDSDLCHLGQRFSPLVPIKDKGPIEGILTYSLDKGLYGNFIGATLKFKIFIIDRALNKSNVVETSDIVID